MEYICSAPIRSMVRVLIRLWFKITKSPQAKVDITTFSREHKDKILAGSETLWEKAVDGAGARN